jgi:hypothetical protein
MNFLHEIIKDLSPRYYKVATHAYSLLVGVMLALLVNYVLYRLGLPSKPFIYVAF